jgi:hypothetical protein
MMNFEVLRFDIRFSIEEHRGKGKLRLSRIKACVHLHIKMSLE